jgi:hypothetical protein
MQLRNHCFELWCHQWHIVTVALAAPPVLQRCCLNEVIAAHPLCVRWPSLPGLQHDMPERCNGNNLASCELLASQVWVSDRFLHSQVLAKLSTELTDGTASRVWRYDQSRLQIRVCLWRAFHATPGLLQRHLQPNYNLPLGVGEINLANLGSPYS